MTKTLQIRPFASGDEDAILALFQSSFGRPMSKRYWLWRFRDNPVAGPKIELCWDGDTLAAHYAVSPVILLINQIPVLTALSMTTMTHPNYRGLGLFTALAKALYARLQAEGFGMVWGFPNDNSHRGFVRDLAWKDVALVPMFSGPAAEAEGAPDDNIVECHSAGELAQVGDTLASSWPVSVQRSAEYLEWRFFRHPENHYRLFAYRESGQTLGYIVYKIFQKQVDIVDLNSPRETISLKLVKSVLRRAASEQLTNVNCWLSVCHPLHGELERIGFRHREPVTYFAVRPLSEDIQSVVCRPENWYLTLGDSDVF